MIDFLISIPAIICRADVRENNPYLAIPAAYARRYDFSADGIYNDALNVTANQFATAQQAAIGEQTSAQQPAAA